MISLYIIAGFFLALGALELTAPTVNAYQEDRRARTGLGCVFIAVAILAFTEWARSAGYF